MKYLVIGAGGTGGAIAGHLIHAGYETELIARGKHKEAILQNGLTVLGTDYGDFCEKIPVFDMEQYHNKPDVAFLCVKSYSLKSIIPLLTCLSDNGSIIVPILNSLDICEKIRKEIPQADVLDAALYISAAKKADGIIQMNGGFIRLIIENRVVAGKLEEELPKAGIRVKLSDSICGDKFRKFMFTSPMAGTEILFDCTVGAVKKEGPERAHFAGMIKELEALAKASAITLSSDMVADGLKKADHMPDEAEMSLYLDWKNGRQTEFDDLIRYPAELGKLLNVSMPLYEEVLSHC